MFRNTKEPSSGGEHLCLDKVTCGSMVLVHVNYCGGIYELQWKKCLLRHICQEQKYVYVVRFISYLTGSGLTCFVCVCVCVCVCTGRSAGGDCVISGAVDHVICTRRPDQQSLLLHCDLLTLRHRASCILGQAFHYSPENGFYIFNQHINFII